MEMRHSPDRQEAVLLNRGEKYGAYRDFLVVFFLFALSTFFQLWNLRVMSRPSSDEGVYLYSARLLLEGYLPYRDFMLVHPPLGIYLVSLFFRFFGINLLLFRLLYVVSVQTIIFPVFYLVRSRSASLLPAVFAVLCFMTCVEFMHNDARFFALRQTALIPFCWGLWLFFDRDRVYLKVLSGFLIAASCGITLAMLFICLPFVIWVFVAHLRDKSYHDSLKWFACGLAAGLLLVIPFFFIPGAVNALFLNQHGTWRRVFSFSDRFGVFISVVKMSPVIFIAGLAGLVLSPEKTARAMGAVTVSGFLLTTCLFVEVLPHHYSILAPALAVSCGLFCALLMNSPRYRNVGMAVTGVMILFCYLFQFKPYLQPEFFSRKTPAYFQLVDELRKYRNSKIFTLQPIYALDGGLSIPFYRYASDARYSYKTKTPLGLSDYLPALREADLLLREIRFEICVDAETKNYVNEHFSPIWMNGEGVLCRRKSPD